MSDKNPNPNDWNRAYSEGGGRSSALTAWLVMIPVVALLGYGLWTMIFD